MKDEDVKLNMKVKINVHIVSENNTLYQILKSKNQGYAYVNTIFNKFYSLSDSIKNKDFHFFYSHEFESYIKEERKIKLKKICSIQEIE